MSEAERILFIGYNALGDTLCTTPVVRAYRREHPDAFIIYICQDVEYCRVLDANPDIDLVIYNEKMYFYGLTHYNNEWVRSLPLGCNRTPEFLHFNMKRMAALSGAFEDHISKGFARLLGISTDTVRPIMEIESEQERRAAIFTPRPYVVLGMHSVTNISNKSDQGGLKEWGMDNWLRLAEIIVREYGYDVFAVGSERESQPQADYIRCLYGLPIRTVAALLKNATCVVTLESGLGHLAAAVDASMVILYADIVPLAWANPREATRCQVIYKNIRQITLDEVFAAFKKISET